MKCKMFATDPKVLADEIVALSGATLVDLRSRWRSLYGSEPPPHISRDLVIRGLAYRMQEQARGGLKHATRRLLAKVAADAAARRPIQIAPQAAPKPGTVLLREWHGTQHQVIVREEGVEFQGKRYKSLSEVARRITGTRWSGPLFFGLKAAERGSANGTV